MHNHITPYEVALHEAGHLLVHAGLGKGYPDKVRIGAETGWVEHHDWSLERSIPDTDHDLRALVTAGGLAVEVIRGRDIKHPRCSGDISSLKDWQRLSDEEIEIAIRHTVALLQHHWQTVEFAADFLLRKKSTAGYIGKKDCHKLFDALRSRL